MKYGLYRRTFPKEKGYSDPDTFYWFDKNRVLYYSEGWRVASGTPKEWLLNPCFESQADPSNPLTFLIQTGHFFEAPK